MQQPKMIRVFDNSKDMDFDGKDSLTNLSQANSLTGSQYKNKHRRINFISPKAPVNKKNNFRRSLTQKDDDRKNRLRSKINHAKDPSRRFSRHIINPIALEELGKELYDGNDSLSESVITNKEAGFKSKGM